MAGEEQRAQLHNIPLTNFLVQNCVKIDSMMEMSNLQNLCLSELWNHLSAETSDEALEWTSRAGATLHVGDLPVTHW